MAPLMRIAALAVLLTPLLAAAPAPIPPELDEQHRALIASFRDWLVDVAEIEKRFQGGIESSDGPFVNLGKVEFILRQARHWPRSFLHHQDHNLVFSAVKGQDDAELERNLPAIINYIQLAVASRNYHWKARRVSPLVGKREGFETVQGIARRVFDFRNQQLDLLLDEEIVPSRVLTKENLGELGEAALLPELRDAFHAGQSQVTLQRNAVMLVVFAAELVFSFAIAVVFLRRRRPATVIELNEAVAGAG